MIDRNLHFLACFSRDRTSLGRAAIDPPQIITRHVTRAICANAVYASISRQKAICRLSNGGACGKLIVTQASNAPSLHTPCKTHSLLNCQSVSRETINDSLKIFVRNYLLFDADETWL